MKSGDLCKILMTCIGASVPKTTSNHLWMTYLQMCIVRLRNITEPITFLLRNIHINKYPRNCQPLYHRIYIYIMGCAKQSTLREGVTDFEASSA